MKGQAESTRLIVFLNKICLFIDWTDMYAYSVIDIDCNNHRPNCINS